MYGKVIYDPNADLFTCEFPVNGAGGTKRMCGRVCRDLARHITRHHQITTREYKRLMGLDLNEPLMSRRTTDILAKHAIENETYKNLEKGEPYRFRKGDNSVQSYDRSGQTKNRLKVNKLKYKKKPGLAFNMGLIYNKVNKKIDKDN